MEGINKQLTSTMIPPPPPAPVPEPTPTDFNEWARFWYYDVGVNVIPANTRTKKTWIRWKEEGYQTNPIPEEVFQRWIDNNEFKNGMAAMAGMVWRGKNKGVYFTFVDLDNALAIKEFCNKNGKGTTLQEIAKYFIVEQHADNPNKAHVYFYSKKPFAIKTSDKNKPGIDENSIPMFEIKGLGKHGIGYCAPSIHQDGYPIQIIGTRIPMVLEEPNADLLMHHINEVCKRYELRYLNDTNDTNDTEGGKRKVVDLVEEGSTIFAGQNRHNGMVQIGMSIYAYFRGKYPYSFIRDCVELANQKYCKPPLDEREMEKNVWRSIDKYIPHNADLEALAEKNLKKIEASSGVNPNELKEKSLVEVTRYNSGNWTIPKVKIIGVSPPYKMITSVTTKCSNCGHEKVEDFTEMPLMSYKAPTKIRCEKCNEVSDVSVTCDHVEAQSVTVQDADMRDDLKRLHVILLDELVKNIKVGETATITGSITVLNPTGAGGKKATTVMYASHVKYEREEESPITDEDIALFEKFAAEHGANTPDELTKMFAPQVIGHEDAKRGLLRSAVCVRENKHVAGLRTRLHSNLAGDPGTAKSTLAGESVKVVPNSRYVTAQHVSIKSVLAIVDKDPDGSKMLMLGAVPQARGALCVINEIGSMFSEDQQHLADIFEEGKFTIDKHGIYQEIDSPTTIIGTTNPEDGYWKGTPDLGQIPVRSNIRDRIDQTYIFEGFGSQEQRRDYALKKSNNYQKPQDVEPDYTFLKRYLQYAALLPDPKLTPEGAKILEDFWVSMSGEGYTSNRGFDSLLRMAKGQARLQLKTEIDAEIARQTTDDVDLMLRKIGKYDPMAKNPVDIACTEVIKYTHMLEAPVTLEDAIKHVAFNNEEVNRYLGGGNAKYSVRENRRYRHIHERFADGAILGQIKTGRDGHAVAIDRLKPLTIAKVVDNESQGQQNENQKGKEKYLSLTSLTSLTNTTTEQSNRQMYASDTSDTSDARPDIPLKDLVKKAMKDKDYFTKDDWVFTCLLWPNLNLTVKSTERTLQQLLQEGKIREVEPGKYKPTDNPKEEAGK